jgi:glycerol-3-phosphate dehydrogenase
VLPYHGVWQARGDVPMSRVFTAFDRQVGLARMAGEEFDVLVVGGGVTGAGVALDAAARGLRTALVERADFASGTSSKSSKLVHGGLRYLQQREFGLVHESLSERHRLLRNAPHLVTPLAFLIPLFGKGGVLDKSLVRGFAVALTLYDVSGGWKIGRRHKRVDAAEVSAHLPTLRTDRLVSGFLYYDARTDDARLTLAVVRTAVLDHGAAAANYAPVVAINRDAAGNVSGATVRPSDPVSDELDEPVNVHARVVVNATGVWGDELRALDDATAVPTLRPAKGIHLTVSQSKLPCDIAAVIPVRGDSRSIFVVPWGDQAYLGTTDTDYEGSLDDPQVDEADVRYVLDAVNAVVTEPITPDDVTGTWAGLRPLLTSAGHRRPPSARTADLSRRHRVVTSPSGLVSITGGKLTTYRRMAEDTVDEVVHVLGASAPSATAGGRIRSRGRRPSPTARMRLRGADGAAELRGQARTAEPDLGVDEATYTALVDRYGGEARAVLALAERRPDLRGPLAEGVPCLRAEVVYAARYEMARCTADELARRTRTLIRDATGACAAARPAAELLAAELGWDAQRVEAEVAQIEKLVEHDLAAARAVGGHDDQHAAGTEAGPAAMSGVVARDTPAGRGREEP